jgi:hypothetical protein
LHRKIEWFVTFSPQIALNTRNSELHSLEELRSQFGQFRESVLKELRPIPSPPANQQSSTLNAASVRDTSADVLPPALEEPVPDAVDPDPLHTNRSATASILWNSDDEINDAHSNFAALPSSSHSRTPRRQSPSSQAVTETLSPAEAGKQAHIIEKERDSLLSSGLYNEHGEKRTCMRFTSIHHIILQIH